MMKVGVFGGSFNPIHNGHVALAQAMLQQCGLDEVWLMVSPQNPLKQQADLLDDERRLEMARKALEGVEGVVASDYEFHLPKPSYTWTTLQRLSEDFPENEFFLLIGGDNWSHFNRWYRAEDILAHYPVVVYPRKGETITHTGVQVLENVPLLDVSSTEIRRRVKEGADIAGLVPAAIINDVTTWYGNQEGESYSEQELQRLHRHLYKITAEVMRVCRKYDLRYFVIGGTAIGVYYWDGIIPWDDDIDIGMPRADYERFLQVAPKELGSEYFLQWMETDPHTPFWFAKVRENNTLYVEGHFRKLPIHHGIFVDVFPFDAIPEHSVLEKLQCHVFGFLHACFIGKEIWQWEHCGRCEVDHPLKRGYIPCLITRIIDTLVSKKALYRLLKFTQTICNGRGKQYIKNIMTKSDKVLVTDVTPPQMAKFGPLEVAAPQHLKEYLLTHYGSIAKYLPKEQQVNHKPYCLKFPEE